MIAINELYHDLLEAYSLENLNKISEKLILLYKNKNFPTIRQMANKMTNHITIDEETDAKCFLRLIMLYHPDKIESIKQQINRLYVKTDYNQLKKFSHIFSTSNIDHAVVGLVDDTIDYNPEYE